MPGQLRPWTVKGTLFFLPIRQTSLAYFACMRTYCVCHKRPVSGYVLTFRCINCGKHEVFANYSTDEVEPEDRIRGRVYKVSSNSCGWNADACGLSAIRISHTAERKGKAAGQTLGLRCEGRPSETAVTSASTSDGRKAKTLSNARLY